MIFCETLCIELHVNKSIFFQFCSCVFLIVIVANVIISVIGVKCYTSRNSG